MKRKLTYALVFAVGFVASFAVRTTIEIDRLAKLGGQRYRQGYSDGQISVWKEAVREGHGMWFGRPGGKMPNLFAWAPSRQHYAGDVSSTEIPD